MMRSGPRETHRLLALMTLLVGCYEHTLVRTSPPNAALYVNGAFVGLTPVEYRVPEHRFSPRTTYRLELAGFEPLEGEFQTYIAPGRIVGGIFALGLPFAFRGATAFNKVHEFPLAP